MSCRASAALVLGLALLSGGTVARAQEPVEDPRSRVLLWLSCTSRIAGRETTLFANGTVRLRENRDGKGVLRLGEVGPDELVGLLGRLGGVDLSEVGDPQPTVGGDWVESCALRLSLADHPPAAFRFSRSDALPLGLARLVAIADELATKVEPVARTSALPPGYQPHRGDVLRRLDGALFRVVGRTADGQGVELEQVDAPLVIYIPRGALDQEFVALERAARR